MITRRRCGATALACLLSLAIAMAGAPASARVLPAGALICMKQSSIRRAIHDLKVAAEGETPELPDDCYRGGAPQAVARLACEVEECRVHIMKQPEDSDGKPITGYTLRRHQP